MMNMCIASVEKEHVLHVIAYTSSSSILLLVNAVFVRALAAPSLLLSVQSLVSVLFILLRGGTSEVLWPRRDEFKMLSVGAGSYAFKLFTNLKTIQYIRVQTYVCLRLTAPLVLSILEYFFSNLELPTLRSLASLSGLASGYFIYALYNYGKRGPHSHWLALWYCGSLFHTMYVKHLISRVPRLSGTWKLIFQQNLFTAMCFATMTVCTELPQTRDLLKLSGVAWSALLVSCPLGIAMSYYSFHFRALHTAASFAVLGVWKVVPVFAVCLIWPTHMLWTGTFHDTLLLFLCVNFCFGYSASKPRIGSLPPYPAVSKYCRTWFLAMLAVMFGLLVLLCWHSISYTPPEYFDDFSRERILPTVPAFIDATDTESSTSNAALTRGEKLCDQFLPIYDQDSHGIELSKKDTVMNTGLIGQLSVKGRLGNRIRTLKNMIDLAEHGCCNIEVNPFPILKGWSPRTTVFKNLNNSCSTACERSSCSWPCPHFNGQQWYYFDGREMYGDRTDDCAYDILRHYFEINATHSFGKACPTSPHVAIHVRSGDTSTGHYSGITGSYISNKVHGSYFLAPTAYYLAALNNIHSRLPGMKVFVFCETMDNPTCGFFAKLRRAMPGIELRVGKPLDEDLFLLLCANEAVTSTGSFREIFMLSGRKPLMHAFSSSELTFCETGEEENSFLYFLENEELRERFTRDVISGWRNTDYQRDIINQDYAVRSVPCDRTTRR